MLITDLVELIVTDLNDNKDSWKPATFVAEARPCLDIVTAIGTEGFKLLIVPELVQYNIEGERKVVRNIERNHFITIIVGYTFKDLHATEDVANWETIKVIVEARQRVEEHIITHNYSPQKIAPVEVESQPVEEVELQRRNFNAITSIAFEDMGCLDQESPSIQTYSNDDTLSPEMRASIRRQALSERRLGRR